MYRLWKYAENTFEVITRRNFKLMHVILTDHRARCRQLKEEEPAEPLLVDAHDTAEGIYAEWQGGAFAKRNFQIGTPDGVLHE